MNAMSFWVILAAGVLIGASLRVDLGRVTDRALQSAARRRGCVVLPAMPSLRRHPSNVTPIEAPTRSHLRLLTDLPHEAPDTRFFDFEDGGAA